MMKVGLMMLISSVFMALLQLAHGGIDQSPEAVEKWFNHIVPRANEKVTKLHFYLHDIFNGTNPSIVRVAEADNIISKSSTGFGDVLVLDDMLTLGPDPDSKIIGWARGITSLASRTDVVLTPAIIFMFTDGQYSGSTLSVQGPNQVHHKYREMAIVGGTAAFRLARGIASTQTVSVDSTTGNGVYQFEVFVLHYSF